MYSIPNSALGYACLIHSQLGKCKYAGIDTTNKSVIYEGLDDICLYTIWFIKVSSW